MGTKNIWKMTAWKYSELENFYLFIEVWGKKSKSFSPYIMYWCVLCPVIFFKAFII